MTGQSETKLFAARLQDMLGFAKTEVGQPTENDGTQGI